LLLAHVRRTTQRRGHVERRALVEIGHELGAEPHGGPRAAHQHGESDENSCGLESQRQTDLPQVAITVS
jgi:hypothetical protein